MRSFYIFSNILSIDGYQSKRLMADRIPVENIAIQETNHPDILNQFDHLQTRVCNEFRLLDAALKVSTASLNPDLLLGLVNTLESFRSHCLGPALALLLSQRCEQILDFLIDIYRHCPPSFSCAAYPEEVTLLLGKTIKNSTEVLLKSCLKNPTFAKTCLKKKLNASEHAFPLFFLIQLVLPALPKKGPSEAPFWYAVDKDGHLMVLKQIFVCLENMLPEVHLPLKLRWKDGLEVSLYTYMLILVSSFTLSFRKVEMDACRFTISSYYLSPYTHVVLFVSDLIKFISRLAPTSWTFLLTFDAMKAFLYLTSLRSDTKDILSITCARLLKELTTDEKVCLVRMFPVRRNFYIWSQIDVQSVLDCVDIIEQMYEESMECLQRVIATDKLRSSAVFHSEFSRHPLAMQCLTNIAQLSQIQRSTIPNLKKFNVDIVKLFDALWRLQIALPTDMDIFIRYFCYLLKLGIAIITYLSDFQLLKLLQYFREMPDGSLTLFACVADFVAALTQRKSLSADLLDIVRQCLNKWGNYQDNEKQTRVLNIIVTLHRHVRCDTFVEDCLKSSPLLARTADLFSESCYFNSLPLEIWKEIGEFYPKTSVKPIDLRGDPNGMEVE